CYHRDLLSFPTRRSSDLMQPLSSALPRQAALPEWSKKMGRTARFCEPRLNLLEEGDPCVGCLFLARLSGCCAALSGVTAVSTIRSKSTRLNSSHRTISYA